MKKATKSTGIFVLALTCSLALSACASPVAPSAKPANFYEAVRSDAEKFWAGYFSSQLGRPYTPIANMQLFAPGQILACGDSHSGPFYCNPDRVVYLDTEFMQKDLSAFGDFGTAVVVAHEIGHHVQNLFGFTANITIHELQADCLAGGWMKDADARGLLEVSDSQEAAGSLFDVGDPFGTPWTHPLAHGTPQQRVEAFRIGFLQGASSCEW